LKRGFVFEVCVMIIDLEPVELIGRPIKSLFYVAKENVSAVRANRFDILFAFAGIDSFDRLHGERQEPLILGSGYEQHAVVKTSPTVVDEVTFGPDVIGEHHDLNTGSLRRRQQFRSSASSMSRVFSMRV